MSATRRVVVISDVFRLHGDAPRLLEQAGFAPVERYDLVHVATPADLESALGEAWAVVAGSERYVASSMARLPRLRAIARPGVGFDAVDVDAATKAGIAVMTTPGANDESVADHAVALILAVLRRLPEHDAAVRAGAWRDAPIGRDLAGLRVGIVGLGAIGRGVARRLAGFGCDLAATEPRPDTAFCEAYGIRLMDIERLASRSDVVTIHAPLMPATRSLIDGRVLSRLPRGAVLVNTSRGGLVDEDALLAALRDGRLWGAGLDVYRDEPIRADHPLTGLPNVVLTGHVASFSRQAITRMTVATIENLRTLAEGIASPGLVNPSVLGGVTG